MVVLISVTLLLGLSSVATGDPGPPLIAWRFAGQFAQRPFEGITPMIVVMFAIAMGSEFRHRTVRQTITWLGSRNAFISSKLIVSSLQCVAITATLLLMIWIAMVTVYGYWDSYLPMIGADVARLALLVILFLWLWQLVGSGLALLFQSQAMSIGTYLGLSYFLEGYVLRRFDPEISGFRRLLPESAMESNLDWSHPSDPFRMNPDDPFYYLVMPPESTGLIVAVIPILAFAIVIIGIGWIRFLKSDL